MLMLFDAIGIDMEPFLESWWLPCGAAGATVVASWLVEAKQSVVENMAPVLARLFTPLFTFVLLTFLAVLLWTGRGIDRTSGLRGCLIKGLVIVRGTFANGRRDRLSVQAREILMM